MVVIKMSINSILCKLFEHDRNGDIDIESLISQMIYILFWGGLVIIVTCLAISGFVYGGYYIINEEAHKNLFETSAPTTIQFIGFICGLFTVIISFALVYIILSKLWDKIKTIKVAHCQIKKEGDN